MKALSLIVSFLIAYGSLYPFSFRLEMPPPDEIERFLGTLRWTGERGNILGNIVLFMPLGALAAFTALPGRRAACRLAALALWALVLAFGLQVAQFVVPSRDPALSDGLWNMLGWAVGLLIGLAGAHRYHARDHGTGSDTPDLFTFPALLGSCWLAYRLAPYVPSIDWQSIKDSLKPLLVRPEISVESVLRSAAGWTTFAALWHGWRGARWSDKPLFLIIPAVMAGEVLVVGNAVTLGNAVGAAAALTLWSAVKKTAGRYPVAALLLGIAIVWIGLVPFAVGAERAAFRLIPFHGLLSGSMYVNFQQLLLKFFLYGGLLWLLVRSGTSIRAATVAVSFGLLAIEVAQMWLPGRTSEITDPVLVLLAAWLMRAADGRRVSPGKAPPRRETTLLIGFGGS